MINLKAKSAVRLTNLTKKEVLKILNSALKHWEVNAFSPALNQGFCVYFTDFFYSKYYIENIPSRHLVHEFMKQFVEPYAEDREYILLSNGIKCYSAFYYPISKEGHLKRIETLKRAIAAAESMPDPQIKKPSVSDIILITLILIGALTLFIIAIL